MVEIKKPRCSRLLGALDTYMINAVELIFASVSYSASVAMAYNQAHC